MNTVLSPQAAKYLNRLNEPDKSRIIKALKKLELEPPQGDIKNLTGKDGYRLRIGDYRALFDIVDNTIIVHAIATRGQSYKGVFKMSAIKKEIQEYVSVLPDSALIALKPLLVLLISEEPIIETDLTEEEKTIILRGREEYSKGGYVPLTDI